MAKAGMQGKGGEGAAMGGDAALMQRAKAGEKRPRLGQSAGMRRGEERQILGPPKREFKGKGGKVGSLDFSRGEGVQAPLLAPGPEAVADARCHAPCPAPALFRLGPRHPFGDQPRHAGIGVEPRAAGAAAIDHDADIGNGERGLGNRGGQHHLAPTGGGGGKGGALCGKLHGTKEGADVEMRGQAMGKGGLDPADFTFAGQKDQKPALWRFRGGLNNQRGKGGLIAHRGIDGARQPAGFHRKGAAFRGDHGRIAHQGRDGGGIERGRHDEDVQFVPQGGADFQGQGKAKIGVEAAFVEFIKDQAADARKFGIGLDHAGEDAFGHHLDPGGC